MNQDHAWQVMQKTFTGVLANLPIGDDIVDLRNRVIAIDRDEVVSSLLDEIAFRIEICLDTQCKESQYYYYLLRSYCKLSLGQIDDAVNTAMYAVNGFRLCGNTPAQVYGHWFLGAIYALQKRGYLYLAEINHALENLEIIRQESLIEGDYDRVGVCQALIAQLEQNKAIASKMGTGPLYMPGKPSTVPVHPPVSLDSSYLLLPWINHYHSVRAGNLGNLAAEPSSGQVAIVRALEIENATYNLHSMHGTSITDRQITLVDHEKYGLALVEGQSMNACTPPICEGDYILFRLNMPPIDKDVVVASRPTASADYAFMVKRYHYAEKELRSETHDKSEGYPAIKLGPDHQILGIVIAVAKKEVS